MRDVLDFLRADARLSGAEPSALAHGAQDSVLVWPDSAWLARELGESASASRRSLRRWETTYDITYHGQGEADTDGAVANFVGWVSSFTGTQIPDTDMRDWVAGIAARLLALPHRRVLDIGCGNGLLIEAIGPFCDHYAARDLSATAIATLSARLRQRPDLAHVQVRHDAADAPIADEAGYDLVVINSVCQYFPDAAYLERVLDNAWACLAPGGHIVVGDARPLRLQPVLAAAIASSRAPDSLSADALRQAIHLAWLGQAELLVDPEFFDRFASDRGGSATALLKAGHSRCEMTRYRYDAILARPDPAAAAPYRPEPAVLADLAGLRAWIDDGATGLACLCGCANARIAEDVRMAHLLRQAPGDVPLSALRTMAGALPAESVDPGALERVAGAAGLACEITPVRGDAEGRFDAWFGPAGSHPAPAGSAMQSDGVQSFASRPLLMQTLRRLATSLQSDLAQHLPAARLPAFVLPVLPADHEPGRWSAGLDAVSLTPRPGTTP